MNIENGHQQSKWSAKFCSCDDCGMCIITCFLPCVTFGQIAEMVDEQKNCNIWFTYQTPFACVKYGGLLMSVQFHWVYSCMYRERLRTKFGLPEEPTCDYCIHFCCSHCALHQEHAELKNRGFDALKGWIGPSDGPAPMPPIMKR